MKNESWSFYIHVVRILKKGNRIKGGNAMKNTGRICICLKKMSVWIKYASQIPGKIHEENPYKICSG